MAENKKKVVGTDFLTYIQEKNFYSLPLQRYQFTITKDYFKWLTAIYFKTGRPIPQYYLCAFQDFGFHKVSLFHFFNTISYGNTPWITTFETFLPRWGERAPSKLRKGAELLAGDACKKLIALSECTRNIQLDYLQQHFPDLTEKIERKIIVLPPPQEIPTPLVEEKSNPKNGLKLFFVGVDFFRKGGLEALRVVDSFLKQGIKIEFTIVSKMRMGDYASHAGEKEKDEAMRLIQKNLDFIRLHPFVTNKEVLEMMQKSHISLLPSYADTYGYSILESQAAGCPVISTDIRAFPENNPSETGWLIKVPKDTWGNAIIQTEFERKIFSAQIEIGLKNILLDVMENPNEIQTKANAGILKIKDHHDPTTRAAFLEDLYDQVGRF